MIVALGLGCILSEVLGQLSLLPSMGQKTRTSATAERERERERVRIRHRCIVQCKRYFDMLNRLGVDNECDRRTDRLKPYGDDKPISIK